MISSKIQKWLSDETSDCWIFDSADCYYVDISSYNPVEGHSYMQLSEKFIKRISY